MKRNVSSNSNRIQVSCFERALGRGGIKTVYKVVYSLLNALRMNNLWFGITKPFHPFIAGFLFQNNTDFVFWSLVKAQLCKLLVSTYEEFEVSSIQNRFIFFSATGCFTSVRNSELSLQNTADSPLLRGIEGSRSPSIGNYPRPLT